MKRYRFRLDQVQRVRRIQEDLAASIADRDRPFGSLTADQLGALRLVWDAELRAMGLAQDAVTAGIEHTAAARGIWGQSHQRVRALELLDERQRAEHRVEVDRSEAGRIDDIIVARATRALGEHG
jgi:hypothetical protein